MTIYIQQSPAGPARAQVTFDFTTGVTTDLGYPRTAVTPFAAIGGATVVKVVDVVTPAATRFEAVAIASWTSSGGTLSVGYFTGLEASTHYIITVEVVSA